MISKEGRCVLYLAPTEISSVMDALCVLHQAPHGLDSLGHLYGSPYAFEKGSLLHASYGLVSLPEVITSSMLPQLIRKFYVGLPVRPLRQQHSRRHLAQESGHDKC